MFRKIVMTIFKVKKSKKIDCFTLTIKSLRSSETSGTIHSMNHRQIREDFNFHVHSHRGGTSNLTHEEGILNTRGNARVSVGICSDEPRCWTDGRFSYPLQSVRPIMLKLASRLRCVTLNERMIVNHEL